MPPPLKSTRQRRPQAVRTRLPVPAVSVTEALPPSQLVAGEFLSDIDLAERWRCSPKTLRNQRSLGLGCPFVRLGRIVRYRLSDVAAYEASAAVTPTTIARGRS